MTFLLALLPLQRAPGDVVTLRDGETIEGEVLDVTRTEVTIKTKVHNITTTKKIRRSSVKNIEYKELPEDFWDSGRSSRDDDDDAGHGSDGATEDDAHEDKTGEDTPDRTRGKRDPDNVFVVIPVEGGIGREVTALGLQRALGQSRGRGAGHAIFLVDSGGGFVYEAVQILDVLKEFDNDFVYHCIIEEGAISAASVFAAGADHIYVRPDARLGGAVAYSSDNTSGAAEVDAKFNSIWAANIASRAESKGHQGEVFRAMAVVEAEVWQRPDGSLHAAETEGAAQIDGPTTILTIRASQMVASGMASEFTGEPGDLGTLLGRDEWTEVPGVGIRAMTFAARDRLDMERRRDEALQELISASERFKESDPRQFTYSVVRSSRAVYTLDASSMREWVARSDRAISAGNTMMKCIQELVSVMSRAERAGAKHLLLPREASKDAYDTVRQAVSWLKTHRNNPPARDMVNRNFGP